MLDGRYGWSNVPGEFIIDAYVEDGMWLDAQTNEPISHSLAALLSPGAIHATLALQFLSSGYSIPTVVLNRPNDLGSPPEYHDTRKLASIDIVLNFPGMTSTRFTVYDQQAIDAISGDCQHAIDSVELSIPHDHHRD